MVFTRLSGRTDLLTHGQMQPNTVNTECFRHRSDDGESVKMKL